MSTKPKIGDVTDQSDWLADFYAEHGVKLHRAMILLGMPVEHAEYHLRAALTAAIRRSNRLIDPADRLEYVMENLVHAARSVRGDRGRFMLPEVADARQQRILDCLHQLPSRVAEILIVSHYLGSFGPELAIVMRQTVAGTQVRLEQALEQLRRALGDPTLAAEPGVLEELSQQTTAALAASAKSIPFTPSATLVHRLQRVASTETRSRSVWLVAAVLVLAFVVGYGSSLLLRPAPTERPVIADSAGVAVTPKQPTPSAAASRSLPAQAIDVPLYYLGRKDAKLYRENRNLPTSGDLATAAIEALLVLAPTDPDYESAWEGGRLNSVNLTGHVLTVDLSTEAYAGLETPQAAVTAAMQIVYTVSDLIGDPELRVRFLADGSIPPKPFSDRGEYNREGLTWLADLWILGPHNEEVVAAGPVVVTGVVKANAAAPVVTIVDSDGSEIFNSIPQTSTQPNLDGWRYWTLTTKLATGEYVITAKSTSPAGATPAVTFTETKVLLVS